MNSPLTATIDLLADHRHLIDPVGEMRWQEWGHPPEPVQRAFWIDATAIESGRDHLPVTWVAISAEGEALGAVGLAQFDLEERRDRSPWLIGMIVRADMRRLGVGRRLVAALETWAADRGIDRIWVATGGPAVDFYRACGWQVQETLAHEAGGTSIILSKDLAGQR